MYTREASSLDLFTDSIRLMGDATLCAVLEFDRQLDARLLGEAARACLLAHPVLHSRLVRGNGPAYWEQIEPARAVPVPVEECIGNYHSRVIGPVDPYGLQQFRVRLLRRPGGDAIVINLAHAAADASGLHVLASQLLQEYRQPGSIGPAEGGIPERDTLWTRDFRATGRPASAEQRMIDPMWPDPFGTSRAPASYHRESVSPPELEAVRRHARALGGSVNDLLLAGFFLAMSDITGHRGPMNLFFPVNLRQHLHDGSRVMSNQATNVCIPLERRIGEGMAEILPRVIAETTLLKQHGIGIAEQVVMDENSDPEGRYIHRMAEQMADQQKRGFADIFFSNPGPISLPELDGLADAYVCYPGGFMPTSCLLTSTFRGRMTITMGYQDSDRARTGTRRAIDLFRHYLLTPAD
jgi:NRPS condensation-like uncharacterized protein